MDTSSRHRVAIIGAGFGGIGLAILLKRAGIDFVILEKSSDLGGTWRDNVYPGAACDVPAHLYSFSFEHTSDWSRRFAGQEEILDYLRGCADRHRLRERTRFCTEVLEATYDDGWLIRTTHGDLRAAVLVSACGQLNRPALPDLPGLGTFTGTTFHSARWDHGHDLAGERVAVIGTGASAVQFVPHVAARAARLHVFQRTAPYVIPKPDREYGRHALISRFRPLHLLERLRIYLALESRALGFVTFPKALKLMERSFRRTLRKAVPERDLRRKLIPDYPLGCKRVLISDDYYPALRRPTVDLVTDAITEIRQNAIVTEDGTVHEVDTIIFGTGFQSTAFLAPMRITGRDGRELTEAWKSGAEAYLGLTVHGFPNLYLLYGPNTNLGHNSIVYMLESQFRYVLACLATGRTLEVRADVQSRFNRELQRRMRGTIWTSGCTSWYQTAEGRHVNNWPGYTFVYRRATRRPDPADFSIG
ncbi:MAG: NAD(P)/FAD-dependent oxidoreductase [Streptosporangiaceae bacterium]